MDTLTEIEQKQRNDRRQTLEDAELFDTLLAHRGWSRYMVLIEAVAQNYHATIMKPLDNVMEATKLEFAKGVLSGLTLASALPQMKIKEAQELYRSPEDE